MKLTNKYNLPEVYVAACNNDDYDPGIGDTTATRLLKPPYMIRLEADHWHEIVRDVSDMLFSLDGQLVHLLLERAAVDGTQEQRIYADFCGWKVGGQFDRITADGTTLQDYKRLSVWEYIHGLKEGKTQQLNILLELAVRNGYEKIGKLEIIADFRDWSKSKARLEADYPSQKVMTIPIEIWPQDHRVEFIEERVRLHKAALDKRQIMPDICTADERFQQPTRYAVLKVGNKRATKVYDKQAHAQGFICEQVAKGDKAKYTIEERVSTPTRCMDYCDVSAFCPHHQAYLKGQQGPSLFGKRSVNESKDMDS